MARQRRNRTPQDAPADVHEYAEAFTGHIQREGAARVLSESMAPYRVNPHVEAILLTDGRDVEYPF